MACARSRLITSAQRHLGGMMASTVPLSRLSATRLPATLIALPRGRTFAGRPGSPGVGPSADRDSDVGLDVPDGTDVPAGPVAGPVLAGPGLAGAWPAIPAKYGFALNMVSTMPAIMASTRHPAMTGTIM